MSFHDEPLVVDNGPIGIDVGQKHVDEGGLEEQEQENRWLRKASQFNRIVLIKKEAAGANGSVETKSASLSREKDLTLTLADNTIVTFHGAGIGHDELTIRASDFRFSRSNRRLTENGGNRRIKRVNWFESATQTSPTQFPAEDIAANNESIFVGLYI
jgi:hypothetical protein